MIQKDLFLLQVWTKDTMDLRLKENTCHLNSLDSSLPDQSTIGFILDNVTGEYKDYANPDEPEEYGYYVKDLKVGMHLKCREF